MHSEKEMPPGTLVGLVPGVLYSESEALKKSTKAYSHKTELPYLIRNGCLLNFEDPLFYPDYHFGRSVELTLKDPTKSFEVPPHWVNPYALGQFINHPPAGTPANVCFVDFEVPATFFPTSLMRYFPYSFYADVPQRWRKTERVYQAIGVIALEPIRGKAELFANYTSDRFADQFKPEWLIEPSDGSLASYLVKESAYQDFVKINSLVSRWDRFAGNVMDSVTLAQEQHAVSKANPKLFSDFSEENRRAN